MEASRVKIFTNSFLVFSSLILISFVYFPGLSGNFVFDDASNITQNRSIQIQQLDWHSLEQAMFGGESYLLKRPISLLSLALNHYFTGLDPYYFKLTNLGIHLCASLMITLLSYLLLLAIKQQQANLPDRTISLLSIGIGLAWALHPMNLTSVLYIVQRMTSLAALFTFAALVFYIWGRIKINEGEKKTGFGSVGIALAVFTPLSFLCKENGALTPVFMFLIEWLIFRFNCPDKKTNKVIAIGFAIILIVPAVAVLVYLINHPSWLYFGYQNRDFSMYERILTQFRVVWAYIYWIFFPLPSNFGLYHDDIVISRGIVNPVSTLIAAFATAALIVASYKFRIRAPVFSFGVLFFLVGHSMESTIIPLEIAHEHRNYVPDFGLIFAAFYYLSLTSYHTKSIKLRQSLVFILLVIFGASSSIRAMTWKDPLMLALTQVKHHPQSSRAHNDLAIQLHSLSQSMSNKELLEQARHHYKQSMMLNNGSVSGLVGLITTNNNNDSSALIQSLANRLKSSPFTTNHAKAVLQIYACNQNKHCNLDSTQLHSLIQSSLENPSITSINKANIFIIYAGYLANVEQKYSDALEYALQAVKTFPKAPGHRIVLAGLYLQTNQIEKAIAETENLKKSSLNAVYSDRIYLLEKQISSILKLK